MAKEHPRSIASVVGGRKDLDRKLCIDSMNRTWEIGQRHSGCFLTGKNVEAFIPYWTCYFIELPGLRIIPRDIGFSRKGEEEPTILKELLRLSVKNGDLLKDGRFGLFWVVSVSEYGLFLNGYDDNHHMTQKGLGVLSFGVFEKISTREQRAARKLEYSI